MAQVTLRLEAELAAQLKRVSAEAGLSVNRYASAVLRAAVDPDHEGDEAGRLRARLARAGVLVAGMPTVDEPPGGDVVDAARRRAGSGRPLSDLVAEARR